MQRLLIILGLIIIPFYEILIHALPFVQGNAPDSRVTKEALALVFALSIGLLAVFNGNIKPFRNKYFILIPIYLLFNLIMSPHFPLDINNNEVGDFYFWKPFAEVLCFMMMIIAIASLEINIEKVLRVMVICGTIMAGYVILQKFGFDQFWLAKTSGEFTSVRSQTLGGNLGQPTIAASWMVMMIPLAVYLKKWWMAILIALACLLTQGAMVTLSIVSISAIALCHSYRILIIPILVVLIIGLFFLYINKDIQKKIINRMDGRYEVWRNTINDIHDGQVKGDNHKFGITGVGFGRFSFTFPMKHGSIFHQTHNDLLEFTYDCGLIGIGLLIGGIYLMISGVLTNISPICFAILLSFISIFICSLGSFPFQLGAHQFYASVLVGLLHNDKLIRRV